MKKILCAVVALLLILSMSSCGEITDEPTNPNNTQSLSAWTVFIYLCGSDLESGYASSKSPSPKVALTPLMYNLSPPHDAKNTGIKKKRILIPANIFNMFLTVTNDANPAGAGE